MKKKIRICMDSPYGGKPTFQQYFINMPYILDHFDFIEDTHNPQIVLCYNFRQTPSKYKCKTLFHCCEYMIPNMKTWDYSLKWDHINDPRSLRFPSYVHYGAGNNLVKPKNYDPEKILRSKTKFCAFVYAAHRPHRNQFFDILNSYKHVDAPGVQKNNMKPIGGYSTPKESRSGTVKHWSIGPGHYQTDLRNFLKDYKFVISFENRPIRGYVTEKIYNPMTVNCIPIYLGSDMIHKDFNPMSFISVQNFCANKNTSAYNQKVFDRVAKYVIEHDNNNKLYCETLAQPWYNHNVVNEYADPKNVLNFFSSVFNS